MIMKNDNDIYLSLFVYLGPEKSRWGVANYVYIALRSAKTYFRGVSPKLLERYWAEGIRLHDLCSIKLVKKQTNY